MYHLTDALGRLWYAPEQGVVERVPRACLECPATWTGLLPCPDCGAPGEPLLLAAEGAEDRPVGGLQEGRDIPEGVALGA